MYIFLEVMRMYELLLEKEARLFFRLVQTLIEKNGQSLVQLTEELAASAHQILLSIQRWRVKGRHLQVGVDVVKDGGQLYVLKSDTFNQRKLFATLLGNSISVELLWSLWRNPSYGIGELAEVTFHSPQTIRRRLRSIEPLLSQYGVHYVSQKRPLLQGDEAQLRFFYLHLTFLQEGAQTAEPKEILERVENLGTERKRQSFVIERAWFDCQWIQETLGIGEYIVNERGYHFLWKQLLGLEPVWVRGKLEQALQRFFDYESLFAPYHREVAGDLYRLLFTAFLYRGNLALELTEVERPLNVSVKRLERLLQEFVPQYEHLKNLHPELINCYEMILQKYRQPTQPPLKLCGS